MLIQTFSFFFQKRTCSFTGPYKLLNGQNLARFRTDFVYTRRTLGTVQVFYLISSRSKSLTGSVSSTMKIFAQFTR